MSSEAAQPKAATRAEKALRKFHDEDAIQKNVDWRLLKGLAPFVAPYRAHLVGSLALLFVGAAISLWRPLLMRSLFDRLDAPDALDEVTRVGIILVVLLVVEQFAAFPQMLLMQIAGAKSMAELRRHLFAFLHSRKVSFFDRTPLGRLVTRVTNDVEGVGEIFTSGALNAVGDIVKLVVIVGVLLWMDWHLALVAFGALPFVYLIVQWTRVRLREAYREIRVKTARMNAQLNEQVSGIAVVQAYAREEACAREFDDVNQAYRNANNRSIALDATMDATIEMVSSICIALVLYYIGGEALRQRISFGTLFAFVAYIEMFFLPIRDLSSRYGLLQSSLAGAERIFELLANRDDDTVAAARSSAADADVSGSAPAFSFEDVSFAYRPDAPVIESLDFTVAKGEKVAIVGPTGAGKSTIVQLLLRLYQPVKGTVRVFGEDIGKIPRTELRRKFSVVPQDVFLFPGTVATNIAAGEEPDMDRVRASLDRVGALGTFEAREGGLDAPVLERGSNFSVGERQLVAFARALYHDPPIIVLDEATASVDSNTEATLQRALEGVLRDRTALIIAHRLSTIRRCDRIVVVHRGRIEEEGAHEALLAKGGIYAKLYRLQFSKEEPLAV